MIDTNSKAWRLECEARELLKWSLKDRKAQIALIWEKRGGEAAIKLQDEITRLWKLQKMMQSKQEILSGKTQKSLDKHQQIDLI